MQLRSLELHGFKSFPDKTIIEFNNGLTAVVGPNGSGKSNISDAIRWVLGEQSTKSLRGAKMEDVIFSGTQSRGQSGYASVTLNFDNSDRIFSIDEDLVSIKRKYYRNGDSEYYINASQTRLKDINELLMDSGVGKEGFAVIGQGKIADIISSKSGDRREFFETAAGITKYRYRKEEAQKDLKLAAENMVRLTDILSELESRVEPLKEQAKKAVEFNRLSDEQKKLDVFVTVDLLNSTTEKTDESNKKLAEIAKEYDEFEKTIKEIEQNIQSTFDFMQEKQVLIQNLSKQKEDVTGEIASITAEIAVHENNILHETQNIKNIKKSIDDMKVDKETFMQTLFSKNELLSSLKNKKEAIIADINQLEIKQKEMLDVSNESETLSIEQDKKINEARVILSQVQYIIASKSRELEQTIELIENFNEVKSGYDISNKRFEEEREGASLAVSVVKEKITSINNSIDGLALKQETRTKIAKELSESLQNTYLSLKEKSARYKMLCDMNDSLEGFSKSVKEVMTAHKNGKITGIIGTVSQIITAQPEHAVAIETAVGYAMQNIVVADEYVAKQSIQYLSQNRLGRATFMPLTSVKGSEYQDQTRTLHNQTGFIGIASNLVSFDVKYQGIINFLFGRIVIVDNLDNGSLIAKKYQYKFKIVTLDGQVINAGGTFTGGSQDRGIAPLSRSVTIDKLHAQIKDLEIEQDELKQKVYKSKEALENIANQIADFNKQKEQCNSDLAEFEQEFNRIMIAHEQMKNLVKQNEENYEKATVQRVSLQEDIAKFSDDEKLQVLKLAEQQQEKEKMTASSSSVLTLANEIAQKLTARTIEKSECEKDIEVTQSSIEEMQKNADDLVKKVEQLSSVQLEIITKIDLIKQQIEDDNKLIEQKKESILHIVKDSESAVLQRQQAEKETTILRAEERQKAVEKERLSSLKSRLSEQSVSFAREYDQCIARLWDEYQLTKTEAVALVMSQDVELPDLSSIKSRLISIKQQIKSLGVVNVAAIVEYEEVKTRYDFLNKQICDINASTKELEKIIDELTTNMKTEFSRTFQQINENFKRIFVELFGGGTANLTLSESDNVLESGIEIYVSPPGKIVKSLSLLSGGEQAFIAVAIYFALLTVKPSPFCVLDEIEAALDEVNVVKYAKYLRLLSEKTQFILITHRRGTMEEADTMYGVTMQNEGVSKILKLDRS